MNIYSNEVIILKDHKNIKTRNTKTKTLKTIFKYRDTPVFNDIN